MIIPRIYVVTVTYGKRFYFLKQMIDSVLKNDIQRIVVVDNASDPQTIQTLENYLAGRVVIIHLSENMGSAKGYRVGLEYAFDCDDCEYIWLLDDDNVPDRDSLTLLCKHYRMLSNCAQDGLALLSLRRDREYLRRIAEGESVSSSYPPRSGFLGFHIKHIFNKISKHVLRCSKYIPHAGRLAKKVRVPYGPYGGLFFHKCVLNKVGYPDVRFFLYADDTEYTWRFTNAGVNIYLIPSSTIVDVEKSWNTREKGKTSFSRYLLAKSDSRVYYSIRNQVYFEKNYWTENRLAFFFNKRIYLSLLWLFSILLGKSKRFALMQHAITDGYNGNFGGIDDMQL